jgi:DNA-binding beta-propeller fold protein YncE
MRHDGRWLGRVSAVVLAAVAVLAAPPAAGAAGSVYVATAGVGTTPGTVSQYDIDPLTGALSPKSPASLPEANNPTNLAITPDGRNVYVTNQNGVFPPVPGSVSQYSADPATGALTPKAPATVLAGLAPWGIGVTPDGRSAYAVNSNGVAVAGASTVSQYDIDATTGALSPKTPATVPTAGNSHHIAITPDGRSAYVTSSDTSTIAQFDVGADGRLSAKTPATVAGAFPLGIVVDPDGRSVYATDLGGAVLQFDVDPQTGALSPKSPAGVPGASTPDGIAVTPDGRSVYVGDVNDAAVFQYDVDPATGRLSPKAPASVASGDGPFQIAVSSDGRSAYVTDFRASEISQYDVDDVTGALTPKSAATVATPPFPDGIVVGSLPAATVSYDELCTLTRQSWNPRTRAHVLLPCALLRGAKIAAAHHNVFLQRLFLGRYIAIVQAASGKDLTAAQAATLIADARALLPAG